MDFKNRLKGNTVQNFFETLLEDMKYKIVPLGIEELIREVLSLDKEQYARLGLSNTLRKLPDFFVANQDLTKSFLVEVKYLREWNAENRRLLGNKLANQVRQWDPLHLAIFLGEKARDTETPASYIGVCKLVIFANELQIEWQTTDGTIQHIPWREATWSSFRRFQDVFGFSSRIEDATLIKITELVKSLKLIAS